MEAFAPGPDGPPPPERGRYSPSFAITASSGPPPPLMGLPLGPGRELEALDRCRGETLVV